jgi:hypothetical protein
VISVGEIRIVGDDLLDGLLDEVLRAWRDPGVDPDILAEMIRDELRTPATGGRRDVVDALHCVAARKMQAAREATAAELADTAASQHPVSSL